MLEKDGSMDDTFMQQFINAGQTTVSSLLLAHFHELGITNDEFLVYLELKSFYDAGDHFPEMVTIAQRLRLSSTQVYQIIHRMIQKKILTIDTTQDKQGRSQDQYDFALMYRKLATYLSQQNQQVVEQKTTNSRQQLFEQIETEFGRPLSPMEYETIAAWLDQDHYQADIVTLALREAVLNQAYSLKYMDRILLSWERKHLTTKQQIQHEQEKRQQRQPEASSSAAAKPTSAIPEIPMYNWAEPTDDDKQ
ncbi:DnaD domain-containing protein [Loigolactobacillus zhaoyuanensis]|uniref:DnaD domain-containing protein n=1 Tax=Loigolactobacillus zhaoyuanensis TaxID=2486017 RepID=A0ABW8UBR0_9LACO|nr:DnaD domain protein [Loigolactobacillus zhaoyuanensis]